MRILYFSRSYTGHDRHFLTEIASAGHEAYFLRLEPGVARQTQALPSGVREIPCPWMPPAGADPQWCAGAAPRLRVVLDALQPDVLHAGPVQTCGYMAALAGFPATAVMSWGYDMLADADRGPEWARASREALEHAAVFLCDCEAVARKAAEVADLSRDRIVCFPWGTAPDVFSPGADTTGPRLTRPGWRDSVVALSLRSWEPVYGIPVVLESFRIARESRPELRLILAGDGSERPLVERQIAANGLENAVYVCGHLSPAALPAVYRAADLYLSCSYTDGSSVSLLEAMATGLPAIVSDIPGNREWVSDGVNGRLAAAGNPREFADAIIALAAAGPERRAEMGAIGRSRILERADWRRNAPKLLAAYQSIAGQEKAA